MSLEPGTRLGAYEIVGPLGAGGMGEVYKARDTRLDRAVAIKVLPPALAGDPQFRERFEREARAISSLSHPSICPLYDIGHHDGTDYLVMEFLEGETLAARVSRGPLPLDQVLRYGIEIAAALAAAHRNGIVHRDLKPGNVMLTRTGARLLDFGLAKPSAAMPGGGTDLTISAPLTAQGTLVGTYQYMSPEQVEGKDADQRCDIFALGVVLYEMATGKRAFDGNTPASIIAAVLEREPPRLSTIQPLVPATLDDIVHGCLAKDPDDRWQHAHDVKLQLESLRKHGSTLSQLPAGRSKRLWIGRAAAIATLALAAALAGRYWAPTPERAPLMRVSLQPPAAHSFTPNDFAISPDGRRVAFVAASADGVSTLWVRALDSVQPAEIRGSEGATSPFWSPDGKWIAFFTHGQLMKVEHGGIGLQSICPTTLTANGGAWGGDDVILFSAEVIGPLYRVHAAGGTATPVTVVAPDTPGEAHRFPQWLPDGRRFLYLVAWTKRPREGLYLGSLDGSAPQLISSKIRSTPILNAGHLLYVDAGTLYARPFDGRRGVLTGSPRAVVRNEVVSDWRFGEVPLSASDSGTLVYQPRNTSQLVWYDRGGRELGTVGQRGYAAPMLSPDQRRVAVSFDNKGTGQANLWIHDLERNIPMEIATPGTLTALAWSGDGRSIAYSTQEDLYRIRVRPSDGSERDEMVVESPAHLLVNSFSPDSGRLLFMDFLKGPTELRLHDLKSRRSDVFGIGAEGVFSPDGAWVAYLNYATGALELARPGNSERVHVTAAGSQVRWRRDMTELFYVAADKKMMAVPLTTRDGTISPGIPSELFQTRIIEPRLVLFQYDVTKDGQRFLINSLPREDAASPLVLLFNWTRAIDR
jgi:serine/threonine protein kinase